MDPDIFARHSLLNPTPLQHSDDSDFEDLDISSLKSLLEAEQIKFENYNNKAKESSLKISKFTSIILKKLCKPAAGNSVGQNSPKLAAKSIDNSTENDYDFPLNPMIFDEAEPMESNFLQDITLTDFDFPSHSKETNRTSEERNSKQDASRKSKEYNSSKKAKDVGKSESTKTKKASESNKKDKTIDVEKTSKRKSSKVANGPETKKVKSKKAEQEAETIIETMFSLPNIENESVKKKSPTPPASIIIPRKEYDQAPSPSSSTSSSVLSMEDENSKLKKADFNKTTIDLTFPSAYRISSKFRVKLHEDFQIKSDPKQCIVEPAGSNLKYQVFHGQPKTFIDRNQNSSIPHTMAISTLDGEIVLWNAKTKSLEGTIAQEELQNGFCEDICWIGDGLLVAAAADNRGEKAKNKDSPYTPQQISLVHGIGVSSSRKLKYQVKHIDEFPHEKPISCITPMRSDRKTRWLSGGIDQRIVMWGFDDASYDPENSHIYHEVLHDKHSSGISAVYYDSFKDIVYSGGHDFKLIGYDIERKVNILTTSSKLAGSVREILPIRKNGNLLVVGLMDAQNSIKVFDTRQGHFCVNLAAGQSARPAARNIKISVHPSGQLLAMGNPSKAAVKIWDLRYSKVENEFQQSNATGHFSRAIQFYEDNSKSWLVSVGVDNTLSCFDYNVYLDQ